MNTLTSIYQDIAQRTAGDIYIGVVGPARTGKSTFIKRFMETMVIPNIDDEFRRQRARDELPEERLRPHGDDRRTQVRPRGGGGDRHGGGRGLFRPPHRLRGLPDPRGGGPAGGRPAPDGPHPLVPGGDPHGRGRGDRHPEGHRRALHHRHRGHHRREHHRSSPGGLCGGRGPGDLEAQGAGQALPPAAQLRPAGVRRGPDPAGPAGGDLRRHLPGGELPGPEPAGGDRDHPVGALRVPVGGAPALPPRLGGCPAPGPPHQNPGFPGRPGAHGRAPPDPGCAAGGGGPGPVPAGDGGRRYRHAPGYRHLPGPAGPAPGPLLRDHVPADGVPHPQRRGAAQPAGGSWPRSRPTTKK